MKVWSAAGCASGLLGQQTISMGTSFAITMPNLADNAAADYYANATDTAGNISTCTGPVHYQEDSSVSPPAILLSTPASPSSTSNTPTISGTGEALGTINLYTSAACTTVIASGPITAGGTWGLSVTVNTNATTSFYGKVVDQAGNVSTCTSTPFNYTHDNVAPTFAGATGAVPLTTTSVRVSWAAGSDNTTATGSIRYDVCSSTTPNGCSGFPSFQTTSGGATFYDFGGLSPGIRYWFRVRALDLAGNVSNTTVEVTSPTYSTGVVKQVVAGYNFSCALLAEGTVKCWGDNSNGELGNGTNVDSLTPVTVQGLSNVIEIGAGGDLGTRSHACALVIGGNVYCWGDNTYGQLGNNTTTDSNVPVLVSGVTTAIQLSVGGVANCAVRYNGYISCWGYNGTGGLGDNTTVDKHTAVSVMGIPNASSIGATEVSVGELHTCARLANGKVMCWGDNNYGKLGNNDATFTDSLVPVSVNMAGAVYAVHVSAGYDHTCYASETGTVQCWGHNNLNQLGNNTTTDAISPVTTEITSTGTAFSLAWNISSGKNYSCATRGGGTAYCWGYNFYGQLGNNTTTSSGFGVFVMNTVDAVTISAGAFHACFKRANGTAWCWGNGADGKLGNNATTDQLTAQQVNNGLEGLVTAVSMGAGHTQNCALMSDGTAECWGAGNYLGDNTSTGSYHPLTKVVNGSGNVIANFVQLSSNYNFTCGVKGGGGVSCWGDNTYGQLGDGTTTFRTYATQTSTLTAATAISVGYTHACARSGGGQLYCWGRNSSGQLGNGTTTDALTPISTNTDVIDIGAGGSHTCVVTAYGTVECTGANSYGQIGNGTTTQQLSFVSASQTNTKNIAANYTSTCTLMADGTHNCWGGGAYGQMGNGTTTASNPSAVPVSLATGSSGISSGFYNFCSARESGLYYCWGYNLYGQIGNGTTTNATTPVNVGLATVWRAALGGYYSCAVYASGGLMCWGQNSSGTLGDGTTTQRLDPVSVLYIP